LTLGERVEFVDAAPRVLGERAAAGTLLAGLLPLADYVRLEDRFERLGPFGIAVRGRARSVLLLSRRPIRQLAGAVIAVTEETSTSAVLLRLLLEQRYRVTPAAYRRGEDPSADARLLIGDAALRAQQTNTQYPYEIDLAFEWWLWQHVPCVFAVWAIRKDAAADQKRELETALSRSLGLNTRHLDLIAQERAADIGLPAESLHAYLTRFIYRLSQPEEDGIARFKELVDAHHVL
jgi:chorismate dehydratase